MGCVLPCGEQGRTPGYRLSACVGSPDRVQWMEKFQLDLVPGDQHGALCSLGQLRGKHFARDPATETGSGTAENVRFPYSEGFFEDANEFLVVGLYTGNLHSEAHPEHTVV